MKHVNQYNYFFLDARVNPCYDNMMYKITESRKKFIQRRAQEKYSLSVTSVVATKIFIKVCIYLLSHNIETQNTSRSEKDPNKKA